MKTGPAGEKYKLYMLGERDGRQFGNVSDGQEILFEGIAAAGKGRAGIDIS